MAETIFVCRKCGEKYSAEDYQKSHFCMKCGTLLRKALDVAFEAKGIVDFEDFVREFFHTRVFVRSNLTP